MKLRPPILALLQRWQDLRRSGQEPDLADLCREQPDLIDELRKHLRWFIPLSKKLHCWVELQRNGQTISAEDLCQDAPHLVSPLRQQIECWKGRNSKRAAISLSQTTSNQAEAGVGHPAAAAVPTPSRADTAVSKLMRIPKSHLLRWALVMRIPKSHFLRWARVMRIPKSHLLRWAPVVVVGLIAVGTSAAFLHSNRLSSTSPGVSSSAQIPGSVIGEVRRLTGHAGTVSAVAISPDGLLALTGGSDCTVRLWALDSGRQLIAFTGHTQPIVCVAFAAYGRCAVSADPHQIYFWDVETRELISSSKVVGGGGIQSACLSRDGQRALCVSENGSLFLWDLTTGKLLRRHEGPDRYRAATFTADHQVIALAGGRRLQFQTKWEKENRQRAGSSAKPVVVWTPYVEATEDRSVSHALTLVNLDTGRELHRWPPDSGADQVSFSTDGKRILSAGGGTTQVWDIDLKSEVAHWSGTWPAWWKVAAAPNGLRVLAWATEGQTARTPDRTPSPEGPPSNESFAEEVSGAMFLFAANDAGCRRFDGHTGAVTAAVFSPDGRFVLSGGADGSVRQWLLPKSGESLPSTRPFPAQPSFRLLPRAETIGLPK